MELPSVPILHIQGGTPMHYTRRPSYALILLAGLVLLLGSGVLPGPSFQADAADIPLKVYRVSFAPEVIYAGIPMDVTISLSINTEPTLIPESVNLIRTNPDNTKKVVTRLYDDGTHGDATPANGIFTNNVPLNEPQPTTLKFQFSVGYKGELKRRLSDVYTLEVRANPNFEGIWKQMTEKLANKDLEGALQYFRTERRDFYREAFTRRGLEKVASEFKSVRDFNLRYLLAESAEFAFTITREGIDRTGDVLFWLENSGVWLIGEIGVARR